MEERYQTTVCNQLTGFDVSTEEGHAAAAEQDVFNKLCPGIVQSAAQILDELL